MQQKKTGLYKLTANIDSASQSMRFTGIYETIRLNMLMKGFTKKMFGCIVFLSLAGSAGFAQDSSNLQLSQSEKISASSIDTLNVIAVSSPKKVKDSLTPAQISNRVKLMAIVNVVGYSVAMTGLYQTWYKDYPQSSFHVFNDLKEWQQMDKLGHMYSTYAQSKVSNELWRWTGISRKKRIWLAGTSAMMYQTVIETLDGFSAEWGWSWGDFAANVAGSGMFVAQELAWDEQKIQMKWSFNRKHYADPTLNHRSDELFGTTQAERFLKDYNGQTYWLSTGLKPLFPNSKIPAWLQVSFGTGVEGMYGGYENIGKDKDGTIIFSRRDLPRYRQWYLAPDVDLTKIKTNSKTLQVVLRLLNIVKFPTPSLEFSQGKFKWNWMHF